MGGMWAVLIVIGVFTGALTGFSGGSVFVVVVPFLVQVYHLPVRTAIGSSLAVDLLTSLIVAGGYARSGDVRLKQAWPLLVGALAGPQLGAYLSHIVPTHWLMLIFVIMMLLMGINFVNHGIKNIPLMPKDLPKGVDGARHPSPIVQNFGVLGLGLAVGIVTGLIGASGGVLYLFALIYGVKMPLRPAVGTAILIMAVSALSGASAYVMRGEIAWGPALALGVVSMASGYLMARFVQKIPERIQAGLMGLIILGAALWMGLQFI